MSNYSRRCRHEAQEVENVGREGIESARWPILPLGRERTGWTENYDPLRANPYPISGGQNP